MSNLTGDDYNPGLANFQRKKRFGKKNLGAGVLKRSRRLQPAEKPSCEKAATGRLRLQVAQQLKICRQ